MRGLRIRVLGPEETESATFSVVCAARQPGGDWLDFPAVLEFVDSDTGDVFPVPVEGPPDGV